MIAPELDAEGYLVDPAAWSEDWACKLAGMHRPCV